MTLSKQNAYIRISLSAANAPLVFMQYLIYAELDHVLYHQKVLRFATSKIFKFLVRRARTAATAVHHFECLPCLMYFPMYHSHVCDSLGKCTPGTDLNASAPAMLTGDLGTSVFRFARQGGTSQRVQYSMIPTYTNKKCRPKVNITLYAVGSHCTVVPVKRPYFHVSIPQPGNQFSVFLVGHYCVWRTVFTPHCMAPQHTHASYVTHLGRNSRPYTVLSLIT